MTKRRPSTRQRETAIRLRATPYEVELVRQFAAGQQKTISEILRAQLVAIGALPPEANTRPIHAPE